MSGAHSLPYDAVVIGSGPNGLTAAITLARSGKKAIVLERASSLGGGARSAELTLPGFIHDLCSAVHPLAALSPAFQSLGLEAQCLEWIRPPVAVAHPFDDGSAAAIGPSDAWAQQTLGEDYPPYASSVIAFARKWQDLGPELLSPLHVPCHPFLMARFGLEALQSANGFARSHFKGKKAQGLIAGLAAHSCLRLTQPASVAVGLVLGIAGHAGGWPIPRGGAQKISDVLAACFRSLGGEIRAQTEINDLREIPSTRTVFFDLSPKEILRIAGDRLPAGYRESLSTFRYGPGVYKMDWALSGPIPWTARECTQTATVHLGGKLDELIASEEAAWTQTPSTKPFVLLSQPTLFDSTRAPQGRHIAWAYCHVPHGSRANMSEIIEDQIERFAPGFKSLILARHTMSPSLLEQENPNLVGGSVTGGIADLGQLFFRPTARWVPYRMPVEGWYICSASTPPGAGVHGMCGWHAAQAALRKELWKQGTSEHAGSSFARSA